MNKPRNLDSSLIESLKGSDLSKISSDFLELGFDAILDDGLLKNIPVINTLVSLVKFGYQLSDKILAKKLVRFLYELREIPKEERAKFISRLELDDMYKGRVGENLILILNKLDQFEKVSIVGKLFAANIKGKIEHQSFIRLSLIVDRAFLADLYSLVEFSKNVKIDLLTQTMLGNLGLLSNFIETNKQYIFDPDDTPGQTYYFTDYGKMLVDHGLN